MKFPHFFIDRPIFAAVLSILVLIVGIVAFYSLPVAQYPDVVPPTIVVRASYPGASPEVIAKTVATPLEQEINGVEDMLYMSSQNTADGQMTLTITFKLGTDLDTAQVLVQNRVAIAEPRLPEEVRRLGVTTRKSTPDLLMVVHMLSPDRRYDQLYIGNYAILRVRDVLARLDGVGDVTVFGAREYSMRVWLNPDKMAALDLAASDVVRALREQNVQVAAGTIGQPPVPSGNAFQLPVETLGRLIDADQFAEIGVKTGEDGRITRVRDVARVELGARDYSVNSYMDEKPAVAILISQRPGSNALATSQSIRTTMERMSSRFPDGLEYRIVYDPTMFVRQSIDAVQQTILQAALLVVLVILVFLKTWRAALIPLVTIPVSLVGTFAVMAGLGFSLNNLSLFGLVLSIGIVVDDAIVVVENVERHIERGLAPKEAAHRTMDEVGGAVLATSVALWAVFVPTAFISGISGQFYRQFALTIAAATLISTFNSLTLSPALCALLLRREEVPKGRFGRFWDFSLGWFFRGFGRLLEGAGRRYTAAVARIVRYGLVVMLIYAGLLGLTYLGFRQVPVGFIPPQDQGYLIVNVQLPASASLERTDAVMKQASQIILETPGANHAVSFAGFSGATRTNNPNSGAIFVTLFPFDERSGREDQAAVVAGELRRRLAEIQDANVAVFNPPPVRGLGTAGGFKLQVQDQGGLGAGRLQTLTEELAARGNSHSALRGLFTTFQAGSPRLYAHIDRTKVKKLDVPLDGVFETLQVYLGSIYVNDFNLFGRTFPVTAQADGPYRADQSDIMRFKTRSASGAMVPLGSVVDLRSTTGPDRVVRYNMFPAAEINGDTAPGFSSGQALAAVEELAHEVLPDGAGFEWTDLAYQQIIAGNTAILIFPLCVLFVFLALAAQYESWSLPLAVILIVPMCLLCAIVGVWLRGMDNNILTQIGFVVLVGLATKNAILIVEFAKAQQEAGRDRVSAAIEACRLRLRPVLMTSFSFILGVVPLVIAKGAGAEMRQALGTAVFSGMLGVTFFGLFLTPVFFVVIRRLIERRGAAPKSSESRSGLPAAVKGLPLLFILLTGCATVGPDYQEPEMTLSDGFANRSEPGLSTDEVVTSWWRKFHDPELDLLMQMAVEGNHDLRIAMARLREARALRNLAGMDRYPTVTLQGSYTNERLSDASTRGSALGDRDFELYNAGFDATWELDFFGRVRRSVEASTAELEAVEALRRDVMVSLLAEVGRNYLELRGSQARLEVTQQNARNQQKTLDLTITLLEGGRGTELDTSRARAQLNSTLATIPPLEASVKKSLHRLGVLTGQQPNALEPEYSQYAPLPFLPHIVNIGQPEELLRRRPDIRAAERDLAAVTARIGVASGDLFPRVTFVGNVALEANSLSNFTGSGSDAYSFGPRISWAAFDLGRVRSRVRAADARAEEFVARYEQTVLRALEETENALVNFGREQVRYRFLRESEEASRRAMGLALLRYENGVSDFLTVLDAERTLLEAQDLLAESQTLTATALVAVYKALGGGMEIAEE